MPPSPRASRIWCRCARTRPVSRAGWARSRTCFRATLCLSGGLASAKVRESGGERFEKVTRVGASGPLSMGTSLGDSDGGGRSEDELPEGREGVRTAAPLTARAGGCSSFRSRPRSPIDYPRTTGQFRSSQKETQTGCFPFSRPHRELEYIPPRTDNDRTAGTSGVALHHPFPLGGVGAVALPNHDPRGPLMPLPALAHPENSGLALPTCNRYFLSATIRVILGIDHEHGAIGDPDRYCQYPEAPAA
jgi:hypothetical protein